MFRFKAWPQRAQFRQWKLAFKKAVSSGSGKSEECYKWISQVEAAKDWKDLVNKEDDQFIELNAKIASGLAQILQGDICKQIEIIETELDKEHKLLNGRQIAWLIYDYFKTSTTEGTVMDFGDLLECKMENNNLVAFHADWKMILNCIDAKNRPLSETHLMLKVYTIYHTIIHFHFNPI